MGWCPRQGSNLRPRPGLDEDIPVAAGIANEREPNGSTGVPPTLTPVDLVDTLPIACHTAVNRATDDLAGEEDRAVTKSTRIRRVFWRVLVIILAILLIAGGLWTFWGHTLDRRYEALVTELHGMGVPTWEQLKKDVPAEADNGWPFLVQAARRFDEVMKAHIENRDDGLDFLNDSEEWTEAQKRHWESLRPQIEPCLRLVEEAVRRPLIVPPPGDGPMYTDSGPVTYEVKRLLTNGAFLDAAAASRVLPLYFELASRWRPCTLGGIWRMVLRFPALRRMREGIASDALDLAPVRGRLEAGLGAWNPVAEYGRERVTGTVTLVWLWDEFRAGRDPTGRMRETLTEFRSSVGEDDEDNPLAGFRLPPTGWMATWFGRPPMLQRAIEELEVRRTLHTTELTVDGMGRSSDRAERLVGLADVARVRLAKLVLRIVAFRDEHGRFPAGLSDPKLGLEKVLRTDPFTGEPFRFEADTGGVTIRSAFPPGSEPPEGEEARREWLRGNNLLWRIPAK